MDEFGVLASHVRQFDLNLQNYLYSDPNVLEESESFYRNTINVNSEQIIAFQKYGLQDSIKVSTWFYMNEKEVDAFMALKNHLKIRKTIENKFAPNSKETIDKFIVTELMYGVRKVCADFNFKSEKAGAFLSIFFLTHNYFTSRLRTTAEECFAYFKELLIAHCLCAPPDSMKIFTPLEAREIAIFFVTYYLMYTPLIRVLSLPNFGLELHYPLQPEMAKPKKKKEKGKKGKKDKKKGKKKK